MVGFLFASLKLRFPLIVVYACHSQTPAVGGTPILAIFLPLTIRYNPLLAQPRDRDFMLTGRKIM